MEGSAYCSCRRGYAEEMTWLCQQEELYRLVTILSEHGDTPTRRTVQVSNNIVRTRRVQPTVAVDVAMTYTPRRTVQVSNNIVRTWRLYTPTRRTVQVSNNIVRT